jgi:hypothetical protein
LPASSGVAALSWDAQVPTVLPAMVMESHWWAVEVERVSGAERLVDGGGKGFGC